MGDLCSIPGLGRSPGEGNSYPLQYSGLENSMDYSPWGQKELDTTEWLSLSLLFIFAGLDLSYSTLDLYFQHVGSSSLTRD